MDEFEKKFVGTWKFSDRDENMEAAMKAMAVPEETAKFMLSTKPTMIISRDGDMISHRTEIAPGMVDDIKYKFGEEFVAKDPNNDPPLYHNKVMATFENGAVKYISRSQLTGEAKVDHETVITVNGNDMCAVSDKIGDKSAAGKRFYKKA